MNIDPVRCWKTSNPLYIKYHDEEWGVPVHDDIKLFEFLTLGGFQAGLSWELVLKKREAFREAFDNFDPKKISQYSNLKINQLMADHRLIRNRGKILAAINNARLVIDIQKEYGSFDKYLWNFINGKQIIHSCTDFSQLPTEIDESIEISKDLKRREFKYVGPTICYAFMQAVGMVNDHLTTCFRHKKYGR